MKPFTRCSPPVCLLLVLLSCPPLSHANGVWFVDPVTGTDDAEGTTSDAPTTTQLVTTHTEMTEASTGMLSSSGTETTEDTTATFDATTPPGKCKVPYFSSDLTMTSIPQPFYDVSDTIQWQCELFDLCYTVNGHREQTCQENNTWSGSVPSCRYNDTAYRCEDPHNSTSFPSMNSYNIYRSNLDIYVRGTNGNDADMTACGTTLLFRCRPGHQILDDYTAVNITCLNQQGWSRSGYITCQAKLHFIGCKTLLLSSLYKYTQTSLIPNGERHCRNHCQKTSNVFSVLLGTDQCLCTNDSASVLHTASVNPDLCNQTCAGEEDEYCGGYTDTGQSNGSSLSVSATAVVKGAVYWTVGGCYSGQQALKATNIMTDDAKVTPVVCRQFCTTQNFLYAALAGTVCTCFQEEDVHVLHAQQLVASTSACDVKCLEDESQMCGGTNAVSVFNLDPDIVYETAATCYELYTMGVRSHGYYKLLDGIRFCYMADNTTCDEEWVGFEGQCYLFVTEKARHTDALSACGQEGGHLISTRTWTELEFFKITLSTFTPYNATDPWLIGLYDPDHNARFTWADGTPILAFGFSVHGPSNPEDGACVRAHRYLGSWTWEVRQCSDNIQGYVCEKPAELETCVRSESLMYTTNFLTLAAMTVSVCRQYCRGMADGHSLYAVLNDQSCACVDESELSNAGSVTSAKGQCRYPCTGNPGQICGHPTDPYIFNVYPPLSQKDLAWTCDDLYYSGVNYSSTYVLKYPEGNISTEYCDFTDHVTLCPVSWFYVDGTCLAPRTGLAQDVHEATALCSKQGGFLTTRDMQGGDSFLTALIERVALFKQRLQYQLHMLGVMAPLQSLVFRTVDGSILSSANFALGHPDNAQQMCVVRDLEYNEWLTVHCSLPAMFVCQKDVVLTAILSNASTTGSGTTTLLSKLTCLSSISDFDGLDKHMTFTFADMTLTVCVELCRGQSMPWAVVDYDVCSCYGDGRITWEALGGADHRVVCGHHCPGNQFQYCGGGGEVVVMMVDMYTEHARSCTQLYMEGVRVEATYKIQSDLAITPSDTQCFFMDSFSLNGRPDGWIHFQNNFYLFHPGSTTRKEAQALCWEEGGGYLMSVVSSDEDTFLKVTVGGLASYRNRHWLIGLTDAGQNNVLGWMAPDLFLMETNISFTCTGNGDCCFEMSVDTATEQLTVGYFPCSSPSGFICKRSSGQQGCYATSPAGLDPPFLSNDPDMSTLLCRQACRGLGHVNGGYALAGRDCYCIQNVFLLYDEEELWETEVNYTECLVPCVGHGSQYCGNEDHVLLYEEKIAYLSEMADSCDEILNNGLYVNLTYRLHNQTTDADSFLNCYHECASMEVNSPATLSSQERVYRSNVTVTCPEGTRFPGGGNHAFAVCTQSGWQVTESSMTCKDMLCSEIVQYHASVNTTDQSYGTAVTVTCDLGFETEGGHTSLTTLCQDGGVWSPSPEDCHRKTCPSPYDLENVLGLPPDDVTFDFTTTLTLMCDDGWKTHDGEQVQFVKCNASSLWDPSPQACTAQVMCTGHEWLDQSNNTLVSTISTNSTTSNSTVASSQLTVGSRVNLACRSGYEMSDGSTNRTSVCTTDGDFDPPLENCTAVCDQPEVAYAHVVMQETEGRTVANISCYQGYQFPNEAVSGEAVCLDGVWHNVTHCQLPPCAPLSLYNANVTLTSVGGNVTMATVTCKAVNTFVDGSTEKTYVCLEGSWSPLVEDCVVRCPELTVTSATVELSITSMSQEVATIRCYSGHHFPDETTEKTISCTSSGSWSEPTVDDCVLSSCNETRLSSLSHSHVSTIQTVAGAILKRVDCEAGYQFPDLTQSRVYGCDGGGVWYPKPEGCSAVECPALRGQTNAEIRSDNRSFQAQVRLDCSSGWEFPDGHVTRVHLCMANKTWSPSPQYCIHQKRQCPIAA